MGKIEENAISKLVSDQSLSFISSINRRADQLTKSGKNIIKLSGGDPSHVPGELLSIFEDLGKNPDKRVFSYSPIAGFDDLRDILVEFVSAQYCINIKRENILVCSGACSGLFLTLKTILNPGDKVLIQDPCWEYLPRLIENCGGETVRFKYFVRNSYAKKWDSFLSELSYHLDEGIRAVVINSPLNPTGEVIPLNVIKEIVFMCKTRGVWVVSDDVTIDYKYKEDDLIKNDFYNSENFISVNSFSKNFGLTGFRFGFVFGDEFFINNLMKSQLYTFMYPSSIVQESIKRYLELGKDNYLGFLEKTNSIFKQKANDYVHILEKLPEIEVQRVDGGLFLFPKIKEERSIDYMSLLNEYDLAVAPGLAFGKAFENSFRIFLGINHETMSQAIQRLKKFLEKTKKVA
jgi:aspartate aminotransferase